jgi:VanZ family protein
VAEAVVVSTILIAAAVLASLAMPAVWLPAAAGFAFLLLLYSLPALHPPLRGLTSLAFAPGVLAFWSASQGADRIAALFGTVAVTAALVAAGLALRRRQRFMVPLLTVVGSAWLVAYFSGGAGGADPMVDLLRTLFGLSREAAEFATVVLRKGIHFVFYGTVASLAWSAAVGARASARTAVGFGLAIALTLAAFDEGRQTSVPGRTGSASDVVLDLAGAATFIAISIRVRRRGTKA